jgi:hypothetical protein
MKGYGHADVKALFPTLSDDRKYVMGVTIECSNGRYEYFCGYKDTTLKSYGTFPSLLVAHRADFQLIAYKQNVKESVTFVLLRLDLPREILVKILDYLQDFERVIEIDYL